MGGAKVYRFTCRTTNNNRTLSRIIYKVNIYIYERDGFYHLTERCGGVGGMESRSRGKIPPQDVRACYLRSGR